MRGEPLLAVFLILTILEEILHMLLLNHFKKNRTLFMVIFHSQRIFLLYNSSWFYIPKLCMQ